MVSSLGSNFQKSFPPRIGQCPLGKSSFGTRKKQKQSIFIVRSKESGVGGEVGVRTGDRIGAGAGAESGSGVDPEPDPEPSI